MTAKSHNRGWSIEYRKEQWVDVDTNKPMNNQRACKRCKKKPTSEGHDACLGRLSNVISACCGHGVEKGYRISG